ncbi:hypothetical protein H4R19_002652 [Coemansia spiralis]|nr:hypothetical protein H4R19_002652 [Coemansia spiralis]
MLTLHFLLGLLATAAAAAAATRPAIPLSARGLAADKVGNFKGAVLFKNGYQTSCEIAVLGKTSGFIAANCFDYTSKNILDPATSYSVFFDDSASGTVVRQAALEFKDIHTHPNYDPVTLANNIAIVEFNTGVTDQYDSLIVTNSDLADPETYVRRTLANVVNRWAVAKVHDQTGAGSGCDAGSELYRNNRGWISCTDSSVQSFNYTSCRAPYGTVYATFGTNSMLSAIYSHSVIYGSGTCDGNAQWVSYYTRLNPYTGFAFNILKRPIIVFNGTQTLNYTRDAIQSMIGAGVSRMDGAVTVGGDIYALQRDAKEDPSTHEGEGSDSSHGANTVDSSLLGGGGDSGGLSRAQKIVIGVVVPVGVLLAVIGGALLFNIWKAKRQDHAWDPHLQSAELQNVAWDLGGGDTVITPPPYQQPDQPDQPAVAAAPAVAGGQRSSKEEKA